MKKLNGMKRDFSSLENKKMKNLQTIKGGETAINYVATNKGECYDKETWIDHTLDSTLEIC
ncbi:MULTISPECIES: TIGR04139 family peptide modification target [Chryseobacterium]|uniref:TIGR04139 family peptide modification target n=4 Tax=Chryseobacterium TaxID=59732 RepID=A0ABU1E328_9FLAO|nr:MULTISPECIES: TIGR04139 family peptide modification target [Chryseobacterium]KYH04706.1 hypothetical protein A1704_15155 [Chryseobacterium cucumeris]MDH5035811.1 TIGR04139 family peptide modification target [Chryseobacterium cucumeris]MDR4952196.1 TIGR04139 family peptide modification target [Chryseobacterium sp. ES2]QWT88084.1 TIGR04139 family peptide modification target [Chryseobacterium sp. PCH239]ROH91370.1 TIGR04139 family peptide modification target [Chryseobacterium cucumeris]